MLIFILLSFPAGVIFNNVIKPPASDLKAGNGNFHNILECVEFENENVGVFGVGVGAGQPVVVIHKFAADDVGRLGSVNLGEFLEKSLYKWASRRYTPSKVNELSA